MHPDLVIARKERDYSTLKLWTVSLEDFLGEDKTVNSVSHILGFTFSAQLSGLGRWAGMVQPNRVALRLLASVEEAVLEAGFVNIPAIETLIDVEGILFRYKDTEFGFELMFSGDGSISLRRGGSSIQTFHKWYTSFMPSVPAILSRVMASLDREVELSLRPEKEKERSLSSNTAAFEHVRVLSAGFSFQVACHNLIDADGQDCKNLDVMLKNVAIRVPAPNGRMTEQRDDLDFKDYGRMDYTVSLKHTKERNISQFISVEAPSNANWGALFFRFDYVGENFYSEDGRRYPIKSDLFLTSARCADAYISFFRDIGIAGFIASVMESFGYSTAAAYVS